MFKRAVGLAAVSAVSMFAWAMPARAAGGTADCLITGKAKAAVELLGGTGVYTFTEFSAVCAVTGKEAVGVSLLDINSTGTFRNQICGTGWAEDTAPTVVATGVMGSKLTGANWSYLITFIGGQGLLTFNDMTGGGVINISPDESGTKPTAGDDCVGGFNVAGDVARLLG